MRNDFVDLPRSTALSVPTSRRPSSSNRSSHCSNSHYKLDMAMDTVSSSSPIMVTSHCPLPVVYRPRLPWNSSTLEAYAQRSGA